MRQAVGGCYCRLQMPLGGLLNGGAEVPISVLPGTGQTDAKKKKTAPKVKANVWGRGMCQRGMSSANPAPTPLKCPAPRRTLVPMRSQHRASRANPKHVGAAETGGRARAPLWRGRGKRTPPRPPPSTTWRRLGSWGAATGTPGPTRRPWTASPAPGTPWPRPPRCSASRAPGPRTDRGGSCCRGSTSCPLRERRRRGQGSHTQRGSRGRSPGRDGYLVKLGTGRGKLSKMWYNLVETR